MAQPQLNMDFLYSLFNTTNRKILDEETKKEAYKVVQAYLKQEPNAGLVTLASFYIYFNEPEKAIELINECIANYGDKYSYRNTLSIAYKYLGDMQNSLKSDISCLELNKKKMQLVDEKQYIHDMHLANMKSCAEIFLNNSNLVDYALTHFDKEQKMDTLAYIKANQSELSEMGISLNTYQKFVSIVHQFIHKYYARGFNMSLILNSELDIAELYIEFDEISPEEAFELTDEIDNAVLNIAINDEIFAKEVRKLMVNCTLAEEGVFA